MFKVASEVINNDIQMNTTEPTNNDAESVPASSNSPLVCDEKTEKLLSIDQTGSCPEEDHNDVQASSNSPLVCDEKTEKLLSIDQKGSSPEEDHNDVQEQQPLPSKEHKMVRTDSPDRERLTIAIVDKNETLEWKIQSIENVHDYFKEEILEATQCTKLTIPPKFNIYGIVNGHVVVKCADDFTTFWVQAAVYRIKSKYNLNLDVVEYRNIPGFIVAKLIVPPRERHEVLRIIEQHNSDLSTIKWKVLRAVGLGTERNKTMYVIGIDPASANTIRKKNYRIQFESETVTISVAKQRELQHEKQEENKQQNKCDEFTIEEFINEEPVSNQEESAITLDTPIPDGELKAQQPQVERVKTRGGVLWRIKFEIMHLRELIETSNNSVEQSKWLQEIIALKRERKNHIKKRKNRGK